MYGSGYERGVQDERFANQMQNLRRDRYERGLESKLAQCESYLGHWQRFARNLQAQLVQAERVGAQQRKQLDDVSARMSEAAEQSRLQLQALESQLYAAHEGRRWMASVVSDYRYGLAPFGYLELPARLQPRE